MEERSKRRTLIARAPGRRIAVILSEAHISVDVDIVIDDIKDVKT